MTKKKKMIIAAVAVVLIAGGLKVALGSRQTEPTGTPVTTGTVVRQDLEEVLKQKATLEGTESAEVASKLHYEVKQVLVKEGDKVTKGQLLAVLDSGDIQDQIAQTKGDIQLLEYQQQETLAMRQKIIKTNRTSLPLVQPVRQKWMRQKMRWIKHRGPWTTFPMKMERLF